MTSAGDPAPLPEFLALGTVQRPHGVRGEVRIACSSEHLEFLASAPLVRVGERELRVTSLRGSDDSPILAFEGIDDRDDAGALRGCAIEAHRDDLPPPGPDEWFLADLEGCAVFDADEPERRIGVVHRVEPLPANPVLVVRLGADVPAPSLDDDGLPVAASPGPEPAPEDEPSGPSLRRGGRKRKKARAPELLVPLTREVVPVVDVAARRIEVDAAFLGVGA